MSASVPFAQAARKATVGQNRSFTESCKFTSKKNVVLLAITPNGLKDALREAARSGTTIWCGAGAVSEEDFNALKVPGLTRFNYPLEERDPLVLADALDTIEEHHPGEVVWVEAASSGR